MRNFGDWPLRSVQYKQGGLRLSLQSPAKTWGGFPSAATCKPGTKDSANQFYGTGSAPFRYASSNFTQLTSSLQTYTRFPIQ